MMKKLLNPICLEVAGATLILVSAWWQLYLEQPNAEIAAAQQQYLMERKIDRLYYVTSAIYSSQQLSRDPLADVPAISTNLAGIDDDWVPAGNQENDAENAYQSTRRFRSSMFILGSILVIAGKSLSIWYNQDPRPAREA